MRSRCNRWLASVVAVMAAATFTACTDSSGDDDDDSTDPCIGKTLCASAGISCDGDVLVTCAADADGCLVETTDDCSVDGWVCDDLTESCEDPGSCDDAACEGFSDGASFCSLDAIVTCAADGDGCLIATTVDCTETSQECDDTGDAPECVTPITCDDDPACEGASEGDLSCDGYLLDECTDTNEDGCLELVHTNCTPALCDDSATPACGTLTATGDSCADAIPVLASAFFLSGADFTADFADDVVLTDASCINRPAGAVDAVFAVDLMAGDTFAIAEFGGLDTTRNIQTTCGSAEACVAAVDDPDSGTMTYTAEAAETIYVVVEAYSTSPTVTDYALSMSINPVCGNGIFEAGERCDDGNATADDGCSASCAVEFGFSCDSGSPSACAAYPFLGTFAASEAIPDVVSTDLLAGDTSDFYMIEFSESVLLSGTAMATSTGDLDFYLIDDTFSEVFSAAVDGDETWTDEIVAPGMYLIDVYAWRYDAEGGYTITLATTPGPVCGNGTLEPGEVCDDTGTEPGDGCDASCNAEFGYGCDGASPTVCTMYTSLGSFAAGDAIADTVVADALAAGESDYYLIELTEDVLISGSLVAGNEGDLELFFFDADGEVFSRETSGDEAWTDELLSAGTYVIQVLVYGTTTPADAGYTLALSTVAMPVCGNGEVESGEVCDDNNTDADDGCDASCAAEFGFDCDGASPTVCTAYPLLGSFAPTAAIDDVINSSLLAAGTSDFYRIEFTADVLLSGTLVAGGTGDMDFYLRSSSSTVISSTASGDEAWTDEAVPAGTYVIQVRAWSEADTGYTLSMSTTAP